MPNNFLNQGNMDADFVRDAGKGKVRVLAVLEGTTAPSAAPSVPEKNWLYVNTASTPKSLYLWRPGTPGSWVQVANDVAGPGGDGWALDGNEASDTDKLGTTNPEDLRVVTNDRVHFLIKAPDPLNPTEPSPGIFLEAGIGVSELADAPTAQLFVGDGHPQLGTGPALTAGQLDNLAGSPLRFFYVTPEAAGLGEAVMGVNAGEHLAQVAARKTGADAVSFEAVAYIDPTGTPIGSRLSGSDSSASLDTQGTNGLHAGAYLSKDDSNGPKARLEVGDNAAPQGSRSLELTLGGVDVRNFADDINGDAVGGLAGTEVNVLIAVRKAATAHHPAGMFVSSGRLVMDIQELSAGAALLRFGVAGGSVVDETLVEIFTQLQLQKNVTTGNYELLPPAP